MLEVKPRPVRVPVPARSGPQAGLSIAEAARRPLSPPPGLAGGFPAARRTGRRDLEAALFAAVGAWSAREWLRASGPVAMARLSTLYAAAMGGWHPLARRKRGPERPSPSAGQGRCVR